MHTHVIKVGGENASDLRTAEWLANHHRKGENIAVAISALRTKPLNTTTELLKAQTAFTEGGIHEALPILEHLFEIHRQTLQEAGMLDSELDAKLRVLFETYFPKDLVFPSDLMKESPGFAKEQRFVGYGEVMSAHVLSHLLDQRFHVANTLINQKIYGKRKNLNTVLREELGGRVEQVLQDGNIAIVPGYQHVHGQSILTAYGRGYTDKMAERVAVGLASRGHSPVLHIQKQVPLLSSNPKNIAGALPIDSLSYWTGAEITGARGANAQVLNEHTISPEIAQYQVPIWVYNPFEVDGPKSIINQSGNSESGILFVDGREHVATITVSGFSLSGPGLLQRLTEVFTKAGVSIDSISSSETEVTFTVYGKISAEEQKKLQEMIQNAVANFDYTVEVKNNLGLIYCVGDNLSGHPGLLEKITQVLAREGIDIECVSQSRGQRAVTLGVSADNLEHSVRILHEALVEKK